MKSEPLHWPCRPGSWRKLHWFLRGIGFGLQGNIREDLFNQMRVRTAECLELWCDDKDTRAVRDLVCKAVQERFSWPESYFIPDDPCKFIFWPLIHHEVSVVKDFLRDLCDRFSLPRDALEDIRDLTFSQLVTKVVSQKKEVEGKR